LAVREVFAELEDGDQRQAPGCESRLPPERIEIDKVGVVEDGAELVPEQEVGITVREGGTGNARSVLGNDWNESERKRHGTNLVKSASDVSKLLHYMHLLPWREFASSIKSAGEPTEL
jgi:hypothetical protein